MHLLNERERKILDFLIEDPHIGVGALSKRLEVSTVTVRSDFDSLAEKGYLIRIRGGALPAFHPEIRSRQKTNEEVKNTIAAAAASLIDDGDTVMIEAGTTTALIARYLLGKRDVKVVTDNTLLLPYARSNPALNLTIAGGIFRPESESMVGPNTVQHLSQFHVKTAFVGTDGLSLKNGLTAHIMEAADVVRTMHKRSDRTVLLVDSGKWGQAGFARILPLSEVDTMITDSQFPEDARTAVRDLGIELIIADKAN